LDLFDRVTICLVPETNLYGEEEIRGMVRLRSLSQSMNLTVNLSEADAPVLALKIAGAIGTKVEDFPQVGKSGWAVTIVKRGAAWSVWAGMLAVFATVAWTASHRQNRPFRTAAFTSYPRGGSHFPYQHGTALYLDGDFKGAERELRRAIKEVPVFPDAYNELAYALADQNKLSDAMEAARTALSQSPNSGNILDTVAEMHQRRGEFKAAAVYYEQALRRDLSQGPCQTHEKYGETLAAMGRKKEAIWHLEAAAGDTSRFNAPWQARAAAALAKVKGEPVPDVRNGGPGNSGGGKRL
jgi:Tfp pilus assembly protein PilF